MKKPIISSTLMILCFCFQTLTSHAQTDTLFWFVAPEITSDHGDRPIYLRYSSLEDTAFIEVSMPANNSFSTLYDTLFPNSAKSVDLTTYIDLIENVPIDSVLSKGLKITSSSFINAYYEVQGTNPNLGVVNSDLFVLKGQNALGTSFLTPFQTHWNNYNNINAWASFDIVATEDNTTITINLTQNSVNHSSNTPFSIVLNKGQTYSVRSATIFGNGRFSGSSIESNKPIAVTVKDDSMYESNAWDMAGDQIVPIDILGTEYSIFRGGNSFSSDKAFIVATEDDTKLFSGTSLIATLNKGQTYDLTLNSPITYISSSAPIYVWHISSFASELGGALVPSIGECTGSSQVGFIRSTSENFQLNILVPTGAEAGFTLNGTTNLITASDFNSVPNTDNEWMYARISFLTTEISPENANIISNSIADFHLGVINGSPSSVGFRYGYFSNFAPSLELGEDEYQCEYDSTQLDGGIGKDTYLWSTGDTTQTITALDTGLYWVQTKRIGCTLTDTIYLGQYPPIPDFISLEDSSFCADKTITITTEFEFDEYNWNNNASTKSSFTTNDEGLVICEVTNENGCTQRDTVDITIFDLPSPNIFHNSDAEIFCSDSFVDLSLNESYASYLWSDGQTEQSITTPQTYEYYVSVSDNNGCEAIDYVDLDCSLYIKIPNVFTPNGDDVNDVFEIKNLHPFIYKLTVLNRWGSIVYQEEPYQNNFKGMDKNENQLLSGLYYYVLEHLEGKGTFKSWVQIIY